MPVLPGFNISSTTSSSEASALTLAPPKLMVIGSAAVDITAHSALPSTASEHSTSPGSISLSLGGVARNVAEAAHRIVSSSPTHLDTVQLVSAVGDDSFGRLLKEETSRIGMRIDGLVDVQAATAVCNLVLDAQGALVGGVADMGIVDKLDASNLVKKIDQDKPILVALDGNLSERTLTEIVKSCVRTYTPVYLWVYHFTAV
jgi:pseudouridine-5'-phosphate glycosidase/pseudouridine kinase